MNRLFSRTIFSTTLLVLLIFFGIGHIHQYVHLESEKASPTHDPQTCPECQTLASIAATSPQPCFDGNAFFLEQDGIPGKTFENCFQNSVVSLPAIRSPPTPFTA